MTRRRTTAASRHWQRCSFSPFIHFSHSSPVVSSKVTQLQYIPGSHKWCHPDSTSPSVLPITGLAGDMQAKPRAALSRHSLCVTHHTSHVTRHTSHVTRHTSHVTRHAQAISSTLTPCQREALAHPTAIPLKAGFASFHHPLLVHGSFANRSGWHCVPSFNDVSFTVVQQQQQLSQGDGDKLHQVSNQRFL